MYTIEFKLKTKSYKLRNTNKSNKINALKSPEYVRKPGDSF